MMILCAKENISGDYGTIMETVELVVKIKHLINSTCYFLYFVEMVTICEENCFAHI